jgi:hypothetical protein
MKSAKCLKMWLIALCLVVGTAGLASADLLVEYQGTSYLGATNQNQPLAKVVVGTSDVIIGSFGVYGQAQANTNLKWVIFDSTQLSSPVYLSAALAVPGTSGTFADVAQWYDSPELNFTLLAGHTYAMGLIADEVGASTFNWGASPDTPFGPYPSVVGGGLTLPFMQALDNSGLVSGEFTNTPTLYTVNNSNRRDMSLRVFSPEAAPVPIPPTVLLLGSGLVGLAGLGRKRFFKK